MTNFRVAVQRDLPSEKQNDVKCLVCDDALETKYHIKLRAQRDERVTVLPT